MPLPKFSDSATELPVDSTWGARSIARLPARRSRWGLLVALLCAALLVGSEAADIWVEYKRWVQHSAETVDARLESWDAAVRGVFAPILVGARTISVASQVQSADALDDARAPLAASLAYLTRASPVDAEWFAVSSAGEVLAAGAPTPTAPNPALLRSIVDAATAAGRQGPPVYQISRDDGSDALNIGVRLRLVDGSVAGMVVARVRTAHLSDLARSQPGHPETVLLLLDERQALFERRGDDTVLDADDLHKLTRLARMRSATGSNAAAELAARSGQRYRVRAIDHPDWGLRTAVAVNAEGFIAEYREEWLRRLLTALCVAGLVAAAWWYDVHLRDGLARAHWRLRRQRRAAAQLLDLAREPIAITAGDGRQTRIGAPMRELFGIASGRDATWEWKRVLATEDQPVWEQALQRVQRTGQSAWLRITVQSVAGPLEVMARISSVADPLFGSDLPVTVVVLHPAEAQSGHESGESRLRELLRLTEAEKWHFGQALHDELGQQLAGVAFVSHVLERKLRAAARPEADDAQWLTKLANESIATARGLARGLVPVDSDDPGALAMALREMCKQTGSVFGADCQVEADPQFDAGGTARANHLFHAVQELVANAIKHGQARSVLVRLESLPSGERISVCNDGAGLAEQAGDERRGMGLAGVHSRAAHLGGSFTVAGAQDGRGVVAVIELPHPPDARPVDALEARSAAGSARQS